MRKLRPGELAKVTELKRHREAVKPGGTTWSPSF